MSEVTNIGCITTLDIPPDQILEAAMDKLEHVVIIGYTKDGDEYFAASAADGASTLWMLERCKKKLLEIT